MIALVLAAAAATARTDAIDVLVKRAMAERGIPGAAVVVVRDGIIVKNAAYGVADLELSVPVTTGTIFQLASSSKPFAGTAVALLADDGKLSFEQPLGELLPDVPETWRTITVRQLMNHTSGLPDVFSDVASGTMRAEGRDALLHALYEAPPSNLPGEAWSYDQTGYLLVQMLVEKLSGIGYEEFVERRIFRPAGIAHASFDDYYALVPKRASYYKRQPDGTIRHYLFPFPQFLHTAAGLNTTAASVGRFLAAVFEKGLVKPATREAMLEPARLVSGETRDYACGWAIYSVAGVRGYGHSGGFSSAFGAFPEKRIGVVVLTNLNGGGVEELFESVARAALGRPGP
ncbi:MAG TPA: serine hydrolase domain-containing protein [Candidatus Polarisedimenticolaceae bacterium]|nr:serine hydrolase domain-containing protein [Candidatus Polarisedimenticolaceae bacterium]